MYCYFVDNSLQQQKVTKWSSYVNENEVETDWNVNFNHNEMKDCGKKGRKRKSPESTDSLGMTPYRRDISYLYIA